MARRASLIAKPKKVVKTSRTEQYIINRKYLGDEPVFTEPLSKIEYMQALSWYNYMSSVSDAREFLIDYLKNTGRANQVFKIKAISDAFIPTTLAWTCRLISRGFSIPVESVPYIEDRLSEILNIEYEKKEDETPKSTVSIQDRMKEKTRDLLGEIEGIIDDNLDQNHSFSLYDWLKSNEIPVAYVSAIVDKLNPVLMEFIEAHEGNDEQLKEAYRFLKKKQLEARIVFYNNLIEDAEKYADATKKTRAPRKPRTVSMEKKLKGLKWQKEDATFKVASINPEKIIGAQELWTFNTKYKTLTVLRAQDRGGLQIKGTSILNYDTSSSETKGTGRKSEYYISRVKEGGKIVLRKLMEELQSSKALAYRINENTILLRVIT